MQILGEGCKQMAALLFSFWASAVAAEVDLMGFRCVKKPAAVSDTHHSSFLVDLFFFLFCFSFVWFVFFSQGSPLVPACKHTHTHTDMTSASARWAGPSATHFIALCRLSCGCYTKTLTGFKRASDVQHQPKELNKTTNPPT